MVEEKHRLFPKGQKLYQKENGVRPVNAFTSLGIVLIKTWVSENKIKT